MKIGSPSDIPTPTGPGDAASPVARNARPATPAAESGDPSAKVALSTTAATLMSRSAPAEFDAEKVARIAKAIEDGSFKVDPGAIADKLIANAQELLVRPSKP